MKKVFFALGLIVLFSSLLIISNYNLYLFEDKGISSFLTIYSSWISVVYFNFISFTGNAVKMDWFPTNMTNSSN